MSAADTPGALADSNAVLPEEGGMHEASIEFAAVSFRAGLCWHWRRKSSCTHGDACAFRHEDPTPRPLGEQPPWRSYRLVRKHFPEHEFELLVRTLEEAGFFPATGNTEPPALLWVASAQRPSTGFGPETRVNRLGGRCALTHKHNLQRSLRKAGATWLAPETYILPEETVELAGAIAVGGPRRWVVKPLAAGRGEGVRFAADPLKVVDGPCVVCAYVSNPLTLPFPMTAAAVGPERYKVDLRLYALVTCPEPLEAFLHEQALVRYASAPYAVDAETLSDPCVHLTYIRAHGASLHARARRRNSSLAALRAFVRQTRGAAVETQMQHALEAAVWSTLCCAFPLPSPRGMGDRAAVLDFELFGFDVLLDEELRPWVLEVNSQPDLSSSGPGGGLCYAIDHEVKSAVVADILTALQLPDRASMSHQPRTAAPRQLRGFIQLPPAQAE